ncbi:MAG: hypothetical protein NVSMB64_13500 [Candidatus Velthaea sp.]
MNYLSAEGNEPEPRSGAGPTPSPAPNPIEAAIKRQHHEQTPAQRAQHDTPGCRAPGGAGASAKRGMGCRERGSSARHDAGAREGGAREQASVRVRGTGPERAAPPRREADPGRPPAATRVGFMPTSAASNFFSLLGGELWA